MADRSVYDIERLNCLVAKLTVLAEWDFTHLEDGALTPHALETGCRVISARLGSISRVRKGNDGFL